jgi:hypothetical protein
VLKPSQGVVLERQTQPLCSRFDEVFGVGRIRVKSMVDMEHPKPPLHRANGF